MSDLYLLLFLCAALCGPSLSVWGTLASLLLFVNHFSVIFLEILHPVLNPSPPRQLRLLGLCLEGPFRNQLIIRGTSQIYKHIDTQHHTTWKAAKNSQSVRCFTFIPHSRSKCMKNNLLGNRAEILLLAIYLTHLKICPRQIKKKKIKKWWERERGLCSQKDVSSFDLMTSLACPLHFHCAFRCDGLKTGDDIYFSFSTSFCNVSPYIAAFLTWL